VSFWSKRGEGHGSEQGVDNIRRHLNYANVTATLALLIAVAGGTAYAVDKIGSHDIANNSIRSVDLKNGKAVRGKDVKPGSLTGRQIDESTLNAGPIARVAGAERGDCVLRTTPQSCAATTIAVSRPSQLLVVATGNQESLGGPAQASCRVAIDGHDEPLAVAPGESKTDNTDVLATNGFARTLLSRFPVEAGRHVVALRCERLLGQSRINAPTIAAIAIAAR
jgi:hypothetical protein